MMQISSKVGTIKVLEPKDKLSRTDLPPGVSYALQGATILQIVNTPLWGYVSGSRMEVKDFHKMIGGTHYESGMVYELDNAHDEAKIPLDTFKWVMRYFQEIYHEFKTEAAVLLLYSATKKDWKVLKVLQVEAAGAAVTYVHPYGAEDPDDKISEAVFKCERTKALQLKVFAEYTTLRKEGYQIAGTIHSHCNFSAFHSGIDDADELHFDGLHITIGDVDSGWSFSQRWMLGTAAFKREITDVVNGTLEEIKSDIDKIEFDIADLQYLVDDSDFMVFRQPVFHGYETAFPRSNYGRATNLLEDSTKFGNFGHEIDSDNYWKKTGGGTYKYVKPNNRNWKSEKFEIGDRVMFVEMGRYIHGQITALDRDTSFAIIRTDAGRSLSQDFDDIMLISGVKGGSEDKDPFGIEGTELALGQEDLEELSEVLSEDDTSDDEPWAPILAEKDSTRIIHKVNGQICWVETDYYLKYKSHFDDNWDICRLK